MGRQSEDMEPRFPGDNIPCRTCEMKKPGKIGFKNRYCECYPDDGKPLGVLFNGDECPYYLEEF